MIYPALNPTFRRLLAGACALGMMSCLCTLSSAQRPGFPGGPPPGGRGGGFGGQRGGPGGRQMSLAALPVNALDAVVKLTPDQKKKAVVIHDNFVKSMAAARPPQGQRPDQAAFQKMGALNTQASGAIEALLTPTQKAKLEAARPDFGMYRIAGIPLGLYGQIGLTGAQKSQLKQLQQGVMAAAQGGNFQAMGAAMQSARTKVVTILTPAQKAEIEKYLQAHPDEAPRAGRRGG